MNNYWFDIINAIDDGNEKESVVDELSDPRFGLDSKRTVLKLISQMLDGGYIKEQETVLFVTEKGRDFYSNKTFNDSV